MQGRSNTRMHKCRAAQLAGHQISQGVECVFCFTLIAMAGWQWKLMNELDRDRITTSFGWSKAGPTAAFRLAAILDGNIQLGTGTFLQTSPCVSFKWRAQEVLYNPVGLILHRNDPKANGASRYMVARPIAALTVTLQLKWVEQSLMACQLIYLSGEVMIEKQYTDAACGRDLIDDIREHLLSNSKYTQWDIDTLTVIYGEKVVKPDTCLCTLLEDGNGSPKGKGDGKAPSSPCMGKGKGAKKKPGVKQLSLKRPAGSK